MNTHFFRQQQAAKRASQWLGALVIIAYIITIGAMIAMAEGFVWLYFYAYPDTPQFMHGIRWVIAGLVAFSMCAASLFRFNQLRGDSRVIVREIDAVPINLNTEDTQRQKLINAAEEMAIASGMPLPRLYVLEDELGINALTAGYGPHDCTIVVTYGLLLHLDKDEMQAVLGHEFSHIVNGDVKLNMQILAMTFGLSFFGLLSNQCAQLVENIPIFHTSNNQRHHHSDLSDNPADGGGLLFFKFVLICLLLYGFMVIARLLGWVGIWCTRCIKWALLRNRSYLADASSVQFTRNPEALGRALTKIKALTSFLDVDCEEISHLLFAKARTGYADLTHPSIAKRIQRTLPHLSDSQLKKMEAEMIQRVANMKRSLDLDAIVEQGLVNLPPQLPFGVAAAIELDDNNPIRERQLQNIPIGTAATSPVNPQTSSSHVSSPLPSSPFAQDLAIANDLTSHRVTPPSWATLQAASTLKESLSSTWIAAAHDPEHVVGLLCILLLHDDQTIRNQQIALIGRSDPALCRLVQKLLQNQTASTPTTEQRLAYLELALPQMGDHPKIRTNRFLHLGQQLVEIDQHIDPFEFLILSALKIYVDRAKHPSRDIHGSKTLTQLSQSVQVTLMILLNFDSVFSIDPNKKQQQYYALLNHIGLQPKHTRHDWGQFVNNQQWDAQLTKALQALGQLSLIEKQRLINALITTIADDGAINHNELALLRACALMIGVPLSWQ